MSQPKSTRKYWLVHYGMRRHGASAFIESNYVTEKNPGEFLADLLENHPDNESRLTMAIEIPATTYRRLKDLL